MDIKIAKDVKGKLKDKRLEQNPYSNAWILFNFKDKEDAKTAMEFVKAAYEEMK